MASYDDPSRADLTRNLDGLTHEACHKARAQRDKIIFALNAQGLLLSGTAISQVTAAMDEIHGETVVKGMELIQAFASSINAPMSEVTSWARPHLENMNRMILSQLFVPGLADHVARARNQYSAVFKQRLDGALRDLEVGFIGGRRIAPIKEARTKSPEEIATLRPGFWGMSIDLKIAYRRVRDWYQTRRRTR